MNTKLTLRMDKDLIDQAKRYAATHGKTVSQIVEDYFAEIAANDENEDRSHPLVQSLVGVLRDSPYGIEDYRAHLERKHLPPTPRDERSG